MENNELISGIIDSINPDGTANVRVEGKATPEPKPLKLPIGTISIGMKVTIGRVSGARQIITVYR